MSCLVDDPKSSEVAKLAIEFLSFVTVFPFTNRKQALTVLAATIAANIASSDNPREDFSEIEEYIEDRVELMARMKELEDL